MNANPTSEEKLLRLIRNRDSEKQHQTQKNASGKGMASFFKKFLSEKLFLKMMDGFIFLSVFVIFGLAGYIGFRFWDVYQGSALGLSFSEPQIHKMQQGELARLITPKPLESYQLKLAQRDPFSFPENAIEGEDPKVKASSTSKNQWKLVGILMGEHPQVVIEDGTTKQTFFLLKDEFIGNAQLVEIEAEKVKFSENGQTFEMAR